jgi:hypothetical protein
MPHRVQAGNLSTRRGGPLNPAEAAKLRQNNLSGTTGLPGKTDRPGKTNLPEKTDVFARPAANETVKSRENRDETREFETPNMAVLR